MGHLRSPGTGMLARAALAGAATTPAALAAGTVTKCGTDAQFTSRLAGGGPVTFDCGRRTIVLSGQKSIVQDTVSMAAAGSR